MIRAGILRERIIIQQSAQSESASGSPVETWTKFSEHSASVMASRGREQFDLATTKAEQVVKFIIRYQSGITEQMRILYGGSGYTDGLTDAALLALGYRVYQIESVVDVAERRRRMEIMATLKRK